MELLDAIVFPDGRRLLACGDTVRLGEHDFGVPAERLVAPLVGDGALALSRLPDRRWRVTRLDLRLPQSRVLGDLEMWEFADEHDGAWWFITDEHGLHAIDLSLAEPRVVWSEGKQGLEPGVRVRGDRLCLIDSYFGAADHVLYQLDRPPRRVDRFPAAHTWGNDFASDAHGRDAAIFDARVRHIVRASGLPILAHDGLVLRTAERGQELDRPLPAHVEGPFALAWVDGRLAVVWSEGGVRILRVFVHGQADELRRQELPGQGALRLRASPYVANQLWIIDRDGVSVLDVRG